MLVALLNSKIRLINHSSKKEISPMNMYKDKLWLMTDQLGMFIARGGLLESYTKQ